MLYEWQVAGKPVVVILNLAIARVLRHDHKAAPEAGGLLLGRVEPGSPARVYVDDCEPFGWDGDKGGAPHLTGVRLERFEQGLRIWENQPGKPLSAVGFYRTAARGRLALTGEDLKLLDEYFPKPSDVCLLVKPAENGFAGAFFIRENGAILTRDRSYLEFHFDRPTAYAAPEAPKSLRSARLVSLLTWITVGALAAIISRDIWRGWWPASVPAQPTAGLTVPPTTPARPELNLQIQHDDANLLLTWSTSSTAATMASKAAITITDSGAARTISLTPDEIASGRFLYTPSSDDVAFRLNILTTDNRDVAETVRIVGTIAGKQPASPPQSSTVPPLLTLPPSTFPSPAVSLESTRKPSPPPVAVQVSPLIPSIAEPSDTPVPRKETAPEKPVEDVVTPSSSSAPKPPATNSVAGAPVAPAIPPRAAPAPQPQSSPIVSFGIPPEPDHRPAEIQTIPPKVLRPYPASLPKELRATLSHDFDIAVKVHISNSGKVLSAEPLDVGNGLEKSLAAAALRAAKYWTFTPANLNGVPVAGESVITFRFSPRNQ